jgi:hypothetical protein
MSYDGQLYLSVTNEAADYRSVVHHVKALRALVDRAASRCAKENAEWHDDPASEDHADYHAPADVQFPREDRDQTIRELVDFYLGEMALGNYSDVSA